MRGTLESGAHHFDRAREKFSEDRKMLEARQPPPTWLHMASTVGWLVSARYGGMNIVCQYVCMYIHTGTLFSSGRQNGFW